MYNNYFNENMAFYFSVTAIATEYFSLVFDTISFLPGFAISCTVEVGIHNDDVKVGFVFGFVTYTLKKQNL